MIQIQSKLLVADNSGAKLVICIKILGSSRCRYAYIGSLIKISIRNCLPKSKVKKGEIYNAILVRSTKGVRRIDGSLLKFDNNSVVILNNKLEPLGSRVFGPIAREIRNNERFIKIISLATEVL